ncbi:MAG: OmpP1/FadL family transporter [Pseudomonadota bacterium]
MKKLILTLSVLSLATQAYAGGYRVSIQGQKALGMGHAGVAMSNSAESVFFNPGAITQLDGVHIVGGVTGIDSENTYDNSDTNQSAKTDNPLGTPVNLYFTAELDQDWTYGFGIYTPFGSTVEWEDGWAGSYLVNSIELSSIFIQPTFAYEVNEHVGLGFGPIAAISAVELNRNLAAVGPLAGVEVTVEDSGIVDYGFSLGAFFKVNEKLDVGVQYRSEIEVKSEGDTEYDNVPAGFGAFISDGGYEAEIPLPAELTLGIAYQLSDKLLLAADYNYTFWDAYEELTFEFDSLSGPIPSTSVNLRDYKNTSTYRVGLEYAQTSKLTLRGGMYFDETPIRDGYFAPETPRTDSLGFTAGATYAVNDKLSLDVAALYLHFDEEDNSYDFATNGPVFEGTYNVDVWALGVGLSYKL